MYCTFNSKTSAKSKDKCLGKAELHKKKWHDSRHIKFLANTVELTEIKMSEYKEYIQCD